MLEFLGNFRAIIANYIRTNYALDPLALENKLNLIAVDECLFSYIEGSQQWVVGLITTETNEIRI